MSGIGGWFPQQRKDAREASSAPDDAGFLAELSGVLERAAAGDLEARILHAPDGDGTQAVARHLNSLLDVVDAFVRESQAALEAASAGRYHRRFLTRGMPGTFSAGAARINGAQDRLRDAAEAAAESASERAHLSAIAIDISGSVASAATELGVSAESVAAAVRGTVGETATAVATVESLESTSAEIQNAVNLIAKVAAQTRLLALNATIEAARAGEVGRGFAVVADEVKTLADETSSSLERITRQVAAAQEATTRTAAAIGRITTLVNELEVQSDAVAEAASAKGGLSDLAEQMRTEIGRFLD